MGFSKQEYWSGVPLPSLHKPWGMAKKIKKKKNLEIDWEGDILNKRD